MAIQHQQLAARLHERHAEEYEGRPQRGNEYEHAVEELGTSCSLTRPYVEPSTNAYSQCNKMNFFVAAFCHATDGTPRLLTMKSM